MSIYQNFSSAFDLSTWEQDAGDINFSQVDLSISNSSTAYFRSRSGAYTEIHGSGLTYDLYGLKSGTVDSMDYVSADRSTIYASMTSINASITTDQDGFLSSLALFNGIQNSDPHTFVSYAGALSGSDTFYGNSSAEYLSGRGGNDYILGGGGGDFIIGAEGDDYLWGGLGPDVFIGGAGNDIILGGSSVNKRPGETATFDTAYFSGPSAEYNISHQVLAGGAIIIVIEDKIANRDGIDTLSGIDLAVFSKPDGGSDPVSLDLPSRAILFGTKASAHTDVGVKVLALYDGLLGRLPDLLGLEHWANEIEHGASVRDIGQQFLNSPEGQARVSALNNESFVEQLYSATLHRNGDSSGVNYWANLLDQGMNRVDVANEFVFSDEHLSNLQGFFDSGIFVPDSQASDVARLYYTMLNRSPDESGLKYWTYQLDHGVSLNTLAQSFLDTPENEQKYGSLSNGLYVDALYQNALGRNADNSGLNYWTQLLNSGVSRSDLAVHLSESSEAQNFHLHQIEQGWQLI